MADVTYQLGRNPSWVEDVVNEWGGGALAFGARHADDFLAGVVAQESLGVRSQHGTRFARLRDRVDRGRYARRFDDDLAVVSIHGIQITRPEVQMDLGIVLNAAGNVFRELFDSPQIRYREGLRRPALAKELVGRLSLRTES